MVCDMALELGQDQRSPFRTLYTESTRYRQSKKSVTYTTFVSNWVFDLDLVEFCSVVQLDCECVTDGALLWVVVLDAEALVFDATNLSTKRVNSRVGSRFVGAAPWSA